MDSQDKTTFSLDDEEIVEEEFTERDEEYDDGEEEYDDYDDEEYDDEDYDDEEYDDDYAEEDYDDGYNDDYYDDRLNKVLDEIAELKRGMAPAVQQQPQIQQQPIFQPPQYIYQPSAPPAGSEVVMYNEISRLRDELAKNTTSLEMQKELTRMKEDMARDQKIAEAEHKAEIQRLQSRIDDLLKNAESPQGELTAGSQEQQGRLEGGQSNSIDVEKLLSINEAVLRATRDSDARLQGEIGSIKKQLEELPSLKELNGAVSAVKKAASNMDGASQDVLNKISSDIAALKASLEDKNAPASPVVSGSGSVDTAELLRQLYEIKLSLGSASEQMTANTKALSELANEYKKVNNAVRSQGVMFKDKLTTVFNYAKKLTDSNIPDAVDLLGATASLASELASQPLTRSVFSDVTSFCSERGITSITPAVRDSAERFFSASDKIAVAPVDKYGDYLPDIVAAVNTLEGNTRQQANAAIVEKITKILIGDGESKPEDSKDELNELIDELTGLTVSDLNVLPDIDTPVYTEEQSEEAVESIFDKLEEIKEAVLNCIASPEAEAGAEAEVEQPAEEQQAVEEQTEVVEEAVAQPSEVLAAIEELRAQLASVTETPDMSEALEELRNSYLDISNKLVDISEKIQEPITVDAPIMSDDDKQQTIDDLAYIKNKLDEYDELFTQIGELRTDIIGLTGSAAVHEVNEGDGDKISGLLGELNTQFDKLYEDLSNAIIETETNIISRLGDGLTAETVENAKNDIISETQAAKNDIINEAQAAKTDIINETQAVKNDILVETQAIKDNLLTISDMVYALPIVDTLDSVKAEILADTQAIKELVIAQTPADSYAMAEAIEQLRADVAYMREQAENNASGQTGETEQNANESVLAYLDDISARIDAIVEDAGIIKENVQPLADSMASVSSNVTAVYDSVLNVSEGVNGLTDSMAQVTESMALVNDSLANNTDTVTALGDNIAAINDNVAAINDNVASARDAATATLDALTPITEQLNAILDRLDGAGEGAATEDSVSYTEETAEPAESGAELTEIKEGINTILDTLPLIPQADDLITARDNTYSILDQIALLPQAEDVTYTRDTVAAILDAVNALAENLEAVKNGQGAESAAADEDVTALTEATAADVAYIKQILDEQAEKESDADTLAALVSDVEQVLAKIEDYENLAALNKQEIIDTVSGIREEIHISTLDENMSAAGVDSETRDALLSEISEIRERLGAIESNAQSTNDVNVAALDGLADQLAALQASIDDMLAMTAPADEEGMEEAEGEQAASQSSDLQAVLDELALIRDRLEAQAEYDTVEEILSLRDDVKAARIVDQDEVSSELEAIKNELAAISSGNILDEIRALREDIINLPMGEAGSAPTDGEINLVLNEIVSLRDEVFAFKDEVLGAASNGEEIPQDGEEAEGEIAVDGNDDFNVILDELTALRADQTALSGNVDELKDLISRRTTIGAAEGEEGEGGASAELDVVLDEIINLKNDISRIEELVGEDRLSAVAEQVEEIRALLEERGGAATEATEDGEAYAYAEQDGGAIDLTPIMEQFDNINAALDELRLNRETPIGDEDATVGAMTLTERFDELHNEIYDIKLAIDDIADSAIASREEAQAQEPTFTGDADMDALRAEIEALRAENEQLRSESYEGLRAELTELKDAVRDMALSSAPTTDENGDTSYAALIDEIRALRDEVAMTKTYGQAPTLEETVQAIREALASEQAEAVPQSGLAEELGEIRDEIAQLRSLTTVSAENGGVAEVAAIRDEIAELREMLASTDNLAGVSEDLATIKTDVQALKEEPDLGVMSEILALRDEFQALREQIEEVKHVAEKTDKSSDEQLLVEVQSLRDQLFAISMANINDPNSGESNYESYNNIILDELGSLRDHVTAVGSSSDLDAITEQFNDLKATIEANAEAVDTINDRIDALGDRVTELDSAGASSRILEELDSIRTDMANQRDADMTSLNFMSEMAKLLERQNQYLSENVNTNISDELESLKAEIASSDAVAEEVAKLREVMVQSGSAADNDSILAELADLREELSREKPSKENALILDAISRLRDEITVLAEREEARDISSDAGLSDSLSDLKEQLNEIAGIVEPAAAKPAAPKPAAAKSAAKRGRKPGSGSGAKSGAKKSSASGAKKSTSSKPRAKKPTVVEQPPVVDEFDDVNDTAVAHSDVITEQILTPASRYETDFDAIIDEQASKLGGDGEYGLDPTMTTTDAMDMADKLAKQVANKLIMEQLVEQLGDGGVSEDRVDEILRDILPQEFTTIAETEASDKVRRLANQLVLDKLRSRLNGKKPGRDDD